MTRRPPVPSTTALPVAALIAALALVAALAVPASAGTVRYPPAGNPGQGGKQRDGKRERLVVCKQRNRCHYRTIGAAVRAADGGDLIKVRNGTYREGVSIFGRRFDGLRIVGNVRKPRKVKLEGRGLRGAEAQNGVLINGADRVRISGVMARNFKANGFFVVNAVGYKLTHLIAARTGVYGIYAFNSKGGTMADSEAYYNNDAGFYIGQTPRQAKPKRSIVKRVEAWGNVLGFSGTNMRYVTIKNSDFFNNGSGIVPNALDSEKFPPPEHNVITGNRVFWNNFNYYAGAPFRIPDSGPAGLPGYPLGVGILLFGSQDTLVERNQIFGNWLGGFGAIQQIELALKDDPALKEASVLRSNVIRDNRFGLGGEDLNGRDLVYHGTGTRNCFAGNETHSPNVPADDSTFAPCPGPAENPGNGDALNEILSWVLAMSADDPASFEQFWIRHPHVPRKGVRPLVRWTKGGAAGSAARPEAAPSARRRVQVLDNVFSPNRLEVERGTRIVWKWGRNNSENHDVLLTKRPDGVKRFHSPSAATDFSFARKLRKSGRYRFLCTFHEDMKMRVRVL